MSVLFVCLGNICRSPAAEAVFRATCPDIPCDSAGTSDWHVGDAPYGPMQEAAARRGLPMSNLRARQFRATDFDAFDLIIGMDDKNIAGIEALRPAGNETPVRLLAPYAGAGQRAVPDPYYTRDFDGALTLIESAVAGLREELMGTAAADRD